MWKEIKNGIKLPKITVERINKKVEPILRGMEKEGVKLDTALLKKMAAKTEIEADTIEKDIKKIAKTEFNVNSPAQLSEVLFEKLKLPTAELKKTKSGISTAANELRKIENRHKIIKPILDYREKTKLLSTYLKPLPLLTDKNDRLHTHFGQETNTGRITSAEPNLQNIPIKGEGGSEIRKAFIAERGNLLISADYSQIELRIVASLANDRAMMEAFNKGEDIHSRTAAEIFDIDQSKVSGDQRRKAKMVNFGILYGMSPYGLSQALSIDQKDAATYIDRYFSVHRGIKEYCNRMIGLGKTKGYVETLFGFRRYLPNINSVNRTLADADERIAINTPVQGTAAEILKLAMIELANKLTSGSVNSLICKNKSTSQRVNESTRSRMLLTIHDEILLEAPEKKAREIAELVKKTVEGVVQLAVPIKAEVGYGKNWSEAKNN